MNALNAYNKLNANVAGLKKASEKLSSGYRINRAGDDAAGLAVSEKMRSQIRGLNQAVRNSQDGINMIQTFEGAAQETHSILQRMKELASESANGTYDNATDRAAMQLEFDQLNDELNQIADTDFNGTIVLNGGVMSDGLKYDEATGEFDYANFKKQQLAAAAAQPSDIFKGNNPLTETALWQTVDENQYTDAAAKQLWTDLKLDSNKDSYVDVTFKVDSVDETTGAVTYSVESATSESGASVDKTKFTVTPVNGNGTTISGHGGFKVTAGGAEVDAIFDATDVKAGDLLTLRFTAPAAGNQAPTNAGFADDSLDVGGLTVDANGSVTVAAALTDDKMTDDIVKALDKLNGAGVEVTIAKDAKTPADVTAFKIGGTALADGKTTINGVDFYTKYAAGKLTISTYDAEKDAAGIALLEITLPTFKANATEDETVKFTLGIKNYSAADTTKGADVKAIETESLKGTVDDSVSQSNAFKHSTARLTYAKQIILQTGARSKDAVNFTFNYNTDDSADMGDLINNLDISSRTTGLATADLSLATQDDANKAIDQIDKAINKVSMVRASFGAIQNRLEHKITNLTTTSENLTEAESAIRDTDMASEMMNYTKFNILQQAAQSMLAQANQQPQSILQLLG